MQPLASADEVEASARAATASAANAVFMMRVSVVESRIDNRGGGCGFRRRSGLSLIQLLAAGGDVVEKRPRLAVEKLDIGGVGAAGGGVTSDRSGADGHHLHAGNVLAHRGRLELGIEQVLGAGEDQCLRLDRGQRLGGVAAKSRRGAD